MQNSIVFVNGCVSLSNFCTVLCTESSTLSVQPIDQTVTSIIFSEHLTDQIEETMILNVISIRKSAEPINQSGESIIGSFFSINKSAEPIDQNVEKIMLSVFSVRKNAVTMGFSCWLLVVSC